MKKTVWLMVLVLAGCKTGGTVYPEIDAAGMQETVSTAYLAFSVPEADYTDGALQVRIDTENTFTLSEKVFDTDFWLYAGEGNDVVYPSEEAELYLEPGKSGTLTLVFRCEEAEEYILGYTDVSADGDFGDTYFVRIRVK